MKLLGISLIVLTAQIAASASDLSQYQMLMTSVRTGDTEIFLYDLQYGDMINLTRSPASEDRYPALSPDGKHVAFTSDRDGTYNLYVMDIDGGHVDQLTHEKAPTVTYMPSWNGDGSAIVFGLHGDKPWIASIAPDGSNLQKLGEGHDPCVSPDGKTIAYTGDLAGGGFSVFAINSDGSGKRRLTQHVNQMGAVFPCWSPDGTKISYSDQDGEALEVFVCNADGSQPTQMTHLGGISTPSAWSPDGAWISFRHTDEAYWRNEARMKAVYAEKPVDKRPVWVMKSDGAEPHRLEMIRFQCAMDGSRAIWRRK